MEGLRALEPDRAKAEWGNKWGDKIIGQKKAP
jgi:hypothetical protein